jgi:alanine racemase/UDP-N-acetylmuramoyl-tripeptide--D-alanyl-D-alanine ligase
MVMVKALAYGTDDVRIAKFLKNIGVDILGVSYVEEGVTMRQAGVTQNIFVLNAAEYEAQKAVKWDLEIGVSEASLIKSLQHYAEELQKKVRVHLHVDTGMNRFGCKARQALELAQLIANSKNLILEGLMTHFTSADAPEQDSFTLEQARLLQSVVNELEAHGLKPKWIHACNSSAAIRFGFSQFNMIRIGLAAYGLHASPATQSLMELKPAISLISRIVGINSCVKGETISYGRAHKITHDKARIAVLPIGYFDGLHRNYSDKGHVMIRGKLAPMIGRICMDYMMVDVTDNPMVNIGDPVLIFGEDEVGHYLSPEELALRGGSIVHELMTCLGPRIRRLFIYDEALRPR